MARTQVIHGVDCEIADGELLVVVGPSGCGKSTLLRMIAGLETISAGEIAIGGRLVNDLEPAQRDIAMVFQNYALYPHMTVYANMAYGLKIRGMPKAEIDQRVKQAAAILELTEEMLSRKPRQLSGGQRQRVAMGRAIVREPSVFLFDEPLSNLDAKLRVQMRLEIKRLQGELGITSVYVTHDQVEAMTLGHRLLVLNEGRVEQLGTPIELYARPASLFVAGFIGSPAMNVLQGQADEEGSFHLAGEGAGSLGRLGLPTPSGRPLVLGIRPEHLEIVPQERALGLLQVEVVERLGADSLVHGCLVQPESSRRGHDITLRIDGMAPVSEGDRLPLGARADHLHLFDQTSGARWTAPSS